MCDWKYYCNSAVKEFRKSLKVRRKLENKTQTWILPLLLEYLPLLLEYWATRLFHRLWSLATLPTPFQLTLISCKSSWNVCRQAVCSAMRRLITAHQWHDSRSGGATGCIVAVAECGKQKPSLQLAVCVSTTRTTADQ